jgi:hypothetical protein
VLPVWMSGTRSRRTKQSMRQRLGPGKPTVQAFACTEKFRGGTEDFPRGQGDGTKGA